MRASACDCPARRSTRPSDATSPGPISSHFLLPRRVRAEFANHSAVAEGAIGLARRRLRSRFGGEVESQEVYLPLGDVSEDGARLVLLHTDWRPSNPLPGTPNVDGVLEPVAEFRVFRLWREADASISQRA